MTSWESWPLSADSGSYATARMLMIWATGGLGARERGVRSPFVECSMTKHDIRELSRRAGLPTWDQPASACLSSRIPYGEVVTIEKLSAVDRAEQALRRLGFSQVRVRHHGEI